MAALQSQHFRRAADVAVVFIKILQNKVAFVGVPGLVQCRELASGARRLPVAVNQRRQMFAVEARGRRIHDDDAFNHIAQFAHVARP